MGSTGSRYFPGLFDEHGKKSEKKGGAFWPALIVDFATNAIYKPCSNK